jgi:tripartite-type tricarboxylate transporter receptor subunit TctC
VTSNPKRLLFGAIAACAVAAATAPDGAHAQGAYPTKPIRMIVPFAPGGGTDITARHVAAKLAEGLGQQVVVDNRGGGGGTIGAEMIVRAVPDGYTLMFGSASYTCNAAIYKLPYHPTEDISTVSLVGTSPFLVVLHPSVPIRSVQELVAYAKSNPGKLNFGSTGPGGITHLATEYFKMTAGVDMTHVPYKGTGAALPDLIGGQIQLMFGSIVSTIPHAKSGKLRGIAVTGPRRSAAIPEIPTVMEAGVPGYEVTLWYGVWGPKHLPKEVVARVNREISRAVGLPEIKDRLGAEGLDSLATTAEDFRALMRRDTEKWTKVVKAGGVKAQ